MMIDWSGLKCINVLFGIKLETSFRRTGSRRRLRRGNQILFCWQTSNHINHTYHHKNLTNYYHFLKNRYSSEEESAINMNSSVNVFVYLHLRICIYVFVCILICVNAVNMNLNLRPFIDIQSLNEFELSCWMLFPLLTTWNKQLPIRII